ncbi:MAG: GNAT family N-acetyltransferase [Acholeplasmataceae bacterium]|nr:GNAT family N-acetyltransferase [Acholeplasmataceae bacterium]
MPEIIIRKATPQDLEMIWALRLETSALLKARGIDQWQYDLPNQETFLSDIRQGHFYVAEEGTHLLAMIAIKDTHEPTYDTVYGGAWAADVLYLTVHRLAVKGDQLGRGLGFLLMRFAETIALEKQIPYIRIDTHKNNRYAIRLFESMGYIRRGEIDLNPQKGDIRRIVFDKQISKGCE